MVRSRAFCGVALSAVAGISILGCTRATYRKSADREVSRLIEQKAQDPRWPLPVPAIYPPEDSRMFIPGDIDHVLMPADDPESHKLMQRVDGKPGGFRFRKPASPDAPRSHAWIDALPRDREGQVVLDLQSTIDIGLKNSRSFQTEREDLYLSALDVSLERFRFDVQYTLGAGGRWTGTGERRLRTGAPRHETTVISDGSVRWLTGAGGELLASLANTIVWDFNASTVDTAGSLLNFSFVQPLLRAGGRKVVLERLTQSERTLLANVRQMDQFQKGYYIRLTSGRNSGEGPVRSGAVGAAGLGLLAGTPAGSIGAPRADGLMGLLEEQQRITNIEGNIARLRESVDQIEAAFEAGRLSSRLQVDQARQALYNAQSGLLSTLAAYQTRLDNYKIDLGLPPDLPVVVRDPLLDRLALTDRDTTVISQALSLEIAAIRARDRVRSKADLSAAIDRITRLEAPFTKLLKKIDADLARMRENMPVRQEQLRRLASRPDLARASIELARLDPGRLANKLEGLEKRARAMVTSVTGAFGAVRSYRAGMAGLDLDAARSGLVELSSSLSGLLLALSLDQTAIRLETLALPPIEIDSPTALAIARENRLDWMNARARLVDSWRQIDLSANALTAGLSLTANGEMGSIRNNSARLDARNGNLRLGLRFDSPLSILAERNDYRETLIDYQRARRTFDEFEDRVNLSLRNTLRIVEVTQLNFELRREAVQIAISQVDLARLKLDAPPQPGAQAQFGATTARDLVSALSDLLDAQNNFLGAWVSYEVLRMLLDFELGTMQLNPSGRWTDPGPLTVEAIRKRLAPLQVVENTDPKTEAVARLSR